MTDLLILNNFASRTITVSQIVHELFTNMLKTYFCELVLGFSPDQNQTTAVIFCGLSRSIIIEKMLNFVLWLALKGYFRKGDWPNIPQSL